MVINIGKYITDFIPDYYPGIEACNPETQKR